MEEKPKKKGTCSPSSHRMMNSGERFLIRETHILWSVPALIKPGPAGSDWITNGDLMRHSGKEQTYWGSLLCGCETN